MQKIATCLMFAGDQHGRAEKAMTLYTSVFEDSQVLSVDRYGSGEEEAEGTVRAARFVLAGREFLAMDSGRPHPFGFTPAMSLVVEFERPQELDQVFGRLSEGATVLMELQEYPFSRRFGWLEGRFGISWQLSLTRA